MNIIVPVKQVPDLVEELEIAESGKCLDEGCLRFMLNESDNHAIEQALLIKESTGASVTVLSLDMKEVDESLYTAQAKGVDRIVKLGGDFPEHINNRTLAKILAGKLCDFEKDLILLGVQASDDLDGQLGPILASYLKLPYVGVLSSVKIDGKTATVKKEYPGGAEVEMEVTLPAVLGIQSAEQTPRYVAFSKVRSAMKEGAVEEMDVDHVEVVSELDIKEMKEPVAAKEVNILEGDEDEIVKQLAEIILEKIKS